MRILINFACTRNDEIQFLVGIIRFHSIIIILGKETKLCYRKGEVKLFKLNVYIREFGKLLLMSSMNELYFGRDIFYLKFMSVPFEIVNYLN